MQNWKAIGLMSGTSLDGLDMVCVEFKLINNSYEYELITHDTLNYPKEWEDNLRNAFVASSQEIHKLDISYGMYLGEAVNDFIKNKNLSNIDFIASHGQTIFHKPNEGYTLQIGSGKKIHEITGIKVVCDFRTQDVEFGGQGAPLVPIGDKLLFSEYEYCINLGGFANISFEKDEQRVAFDICPANIVMNHYARKLGFPYDEYGKLARSGTINNKLLQELNNLPYYAAPIPKSLGFEFVDETIFPLIEKYSLNEYDVLSTFTAHVVFQIAKCLKQEHSKVLITGGGAFNSFLIESLKEQVLHEIVIPSTEIIDFKEAIIFAFLGLLKIQNKVNCLKSVTGATKDHSSGKIFC